MIFRMKSQIAFNAYCSYKKPPISPAESVLLAAQWTNYLLNTHTWVSQKTWPASNWHLCSKYYGRDFHGVPVVKNLPCNAWEVSSIPGQGTKISHAILHRLKRKKKKMRINTTLGRKPYITKPGLLGHIPKGWYIWEHYNVTLCISKNFRRTFLCKDLAEKQHLMAQR